MLQREQKIELEFNGSSEEFISQVEGFNNGAELIDGRTPFVVRRVENRSTEIYFRAKGVGVFGYITVQSLPNERALVRVSADDDEDWAMLEGTWNLLASDLEKHGWTGESPSPELKLGRGARPGRPSYNENKWAYRQVNTEGRSRREVFPEWVERAGKRIDTLEDPWDGFSKAVKPKK